MNCKSFVIGLMCGIIISFFAIYFVGNRYVVQSGGPNGIMTFKVDKWTGKSWMARYYEKDGSKIWHWSVTEEK